MRRRLDLRRCDEQGVIAVVVALMTCFVLIPVGALAVDIGVQRVARIDMQSVADMTALDLARKLDGTRTAGQWQSASPSLQQLANTSLGRNSSAVGRNVTVLPELGTLDSATGVFTPSVLPSGSAMIPNAVRVQATTQVDFALHGGSGGATRTAIAQSASTACFKLGSYAAKVNSGASVLAPLNDILGVNLSLASYQALAAADIRLVDLAARPRFGSPTALLSSPISYADLLSGTLEVLNAENSPANTVAITALNALLSASAGTPAVDVLGDVLNVSPSDTAALATNLNVLDIVTGAMLIADGGHAVSIPNLWANVAGTGSTKVSDLSIIQGASTACGRAGAPEATADSAQLKGKVEFEQMNSPSMTLPVGNFKTDPAVGTLDVALAKAHGELAAVPPIHCGAPTLADPHTMTVNVSSELSSIALTVKLPVSGDITVGLAPLGLPLLTAKISLNLVLDVSVRNSGSATSVPANLRMPPNDSTPISTGSPVRLDAGTVTAVVNSTSSVAKVTAGVVGLPTGTILSLGSPLLTSTLNSVVAAVVTGPQSFAGKTITPLVGNINSMLTGPLADLLGLDIAGADAYAVNAVCNSPALRG